MIDSKYALKYSMPHVVVHIVDNSSYTGALPAAVADDPSLYATLVVTGAPMGEDNKIVSITRSDILSAAYGLGSISVSDREKFGQTIDYAPSLLSQGAPVRFMRVTPEDATYGLVCIVMQWRVDEITAADPRVHVRFKTKEFPVDLQLRQFKNTKRLNEALIKQYNQDNVSEDGHVWTQRVFINAISAGRGKVYNNMAFIINQTVQSKNPANVKYEFATVDTRTNLTVERFFASLVNVENGNRVDAIDPANVAVGKRVEGSSILVPYVNEKAVQELYGVYMNFYKEMLEDQSAVTDEFVKMAYATLNVNTFDVIYGNYLYNGTDSALKLPYYQVEMFDSDIPTLDKNHRISTINTAIDGIDFDKNVLYGKLIPLAYGVTDSADAVHVGDLYMSSTTQPAISVIATINQYTKAVTSLTIPKVFAVAESTEEVYVKGSDIYSDAEKLNKKDPVDGVIYINKENASDRYILNPEVSGKVISLASNRIKMVVSDTTDGTGSKAINNAVANKKISRFDTIAVKVSNSFDLYTVSAINTEAVGKADAYTLKKWTDEDVYNNLDWASHSSGSAGVGNVIGRTTEDPAWSRDGATIIKDGKVYVNTYAALGTDGTIPTIEIATTRRFEKAPTEVAITTDIVGASYDVLIYKADNVETWSITGVKVNASGTGYVTGDEISVDGKCTFAVDTVDESGKVQTIKAIIPAEDITTNPTGTGVSTTGGTGSGLTVDITGAPKTYKANTSPDKIVRYIVSGVTGSLFRVSESPMAIPTNYYTDQYGISLSSEDGGVRIAYGSTGFFDDDTMNSVVYKWKYSALLVRAYKGELDPRITSPTRVPAKYLFDGGTNTVYGQTILPELRYDPADIIAASSIFTEEEKEEVLFNPSVLDDINGDEDIDVKQAMYDLMKYRCFYMIPAEKRPIGDGSGMSLHLDSGVTDAQTAIAINTSFARRFDNWNASWDIGGFYDVETGLPCTYVKQLVDNLIAHCKKYTVNKPYVGKYSVITKDRYTSYFPDIDTTDWDMRELLYNSGGNAWIADINGNLRRQSQRTFHRDSTTSDLLQENNVRTLSQLVYLLQNKIEDCLLEYNDDGVLQTLSNEVNIMFSKWAGNLVDSLNIQFYRDTNTDGGDIVVCDVAVTFRGLILRVPIKVNVNRREN